MKQHYTMKKNTYTIPLALVFCLFFLWAISSNLLPTMIRQLMKTCELNTFEASFTETAYWLAYFIFPIPIAMFMKRYSYKAGIIFGLYMLAFLLGRWIGTGLMVKFRPQDMLLIYALMNILLCGVVVIWGGMVGLYAMLAISFFMSIMYPTQFSLALKGLENQTKSGSAFLVMAIVGNACLPQLTAYFMHANEHIYYMSYCVPMLCFVFCAYYGWKGYKVID